MQNNAKNESLPLCASNGKPRRMGIFAFLQQHGDNMGTTKKYITYRPPELKMEGDKWFISYYYRVPVELRHRYKRDWERIKVYENINRFRDPEYCDTLLKSVELVLELGFNPFLEELQLLEKEVEAVVKKEKEWTIQQAVLFWEQQKREQSDIEEKSRGKYLCTSKRFLAWITKLNLQHTSVKNVTKQLIENYLKAKQKEKGWSPRTYNNERELVKSIFILCKDDGIINNNPVKGTRRLKTASKKHKAYDARRLDTLTKVLKKEDPYLYFAFQTVYYLCLRSGKELTRLKVGDILPDRRQVFISAEDAKTDIDAYIPMADEMLKIFQERGILDYPADYYVFGRNDKPGPKPVDPDHFGRRFKEIRPKAKLTEDYTLYAIKHTRIIHLVQDGVKPADIMVLTRHRDFTSFAEYLRDLGIEADPGVISKNSRKI